MQLTQKLNRLLLTICAIILVLMVIFGNWQVITRYLLGGQAPWTDEALRYLLIWLTLLGAPLAHGLSRQMAVTFIFNKLSPAKQRVNTIIVEIIVLIFSAIILCYGGFQYMLIGFSQVSPSIGLNVGLVYTVLPISGILFIIYSGEKLINAIKAKPAKEVK